MRVMPVLDLRNGQAVHAVAGDRDHYAPVRTSLHPRSDPLGLARAFRDTLGRKSLYLADLDAIGGEPPALDLYRGFVDLGLDVWIDAGLRDESQALAILDQGAAGLVVGSETLRGSDALARVVELARPDRVVFSLDLKGNRPILAPDSVWESRDPGDLSRVAEQAGIRRLLLLDLARVGLGGGFRANWLGPLATVETKTLEIWVGGGVAGPDDLESAERCGVSTLLVGSALLDGRIGAGDLDPWS